MEKMIGYLYAASAWKKAKEITSVTVTYGHLLLEEWLEIDLLRQDRSFRLLDSDSNL